MRKSDAFTADDGDGQPAATSGQIHGAGLEIIQIIGVAEQPSNNQQPPIVKSVRTTPGCEETDLRLAKIVVNQAAMTGNWKMAEPILKQRPYLATLPLTKDGDIALHVAARGKRVAFVEKLVKRSMKPDEMALQNKHGNTALCYAATSGVVRIAKLMVKKNKHLPLIRGYRNATPLFMAISYKNRHMASYLFTVTHLNSLTDQELFGLLIATIHSDYYDFSLEIMSMNPKLKIMRDVENNNETILHVLAKKQPSTIGRSINELNIWEKCIINSGARIKGICSKIVMKILARKVVDTSWEFIVRELSEDTMLEFIKHPTSLVHDAAMAENVEFLKELISYYPDLVWEEDDDGKNIFHIAVENRLQNVFLLLRDVGGLKVFSPKYKTTVKGKYNMLHLAAKLPAPNHLNRFPGPAFQMQHELLWFKLLDLVAIFRTHTSKEVEKMVLPHEVEAKCDDPRKLTPRELFTLEHKDVRKDGEKWIKSTANCCMLVATLIITVVFATAFAVPGGSDDKSGIPIFRGNKWFTLFVLSAAAAMFSSFISIVVFLSIQIARYAEEDFMRSLPIKLFFGLMWLFFSLLCMALAFSSTFFILYHEASGLIPMTISGMQVIAVTYFIVLLSGLGYDTLLFNIIYSSSESLFGPRPPYLAAPRLTLRRLIEPFQ